MKNNQTIVIKTSKGDLEVKLFGADNPLTVTNFINNIQNDIYRNKKFYKIINFSQAKIIHGGLNSSSETFSEKKPITKNFANSIPLEIGFKKQYEPKYNYIIEDPTKIVDIKFFFEKGSLAMVKSSENKSSSTEFFFVTNKIPELDGRYSIFGKIIDGLEVLERIDNDDFIYEIKIFN